MAKGKKAKDNKEEEGNKSSDGQEAPPGQSGTSQGQSGGAEGGGQRREGGGGGRGGGGGGGRGGGGGQRGQSGQGQSGGSGSGGAPGGQRREGGRGGRGGGQPGGQQGSFDSQQQNQGQSGQSGGSGGGGRGGGGRRGGGGGGPHGQQGGFDSQQQQQQSQSGGGGGQRGEGGGGQRGEGGRGGRGGGGRGGDGGRSGGQQGSFDSQQQNRGQSGQSGGGGRGGRGGGGGGPHGQQQQQGSFDSQQQQQQQQQSQSGGSGGGGGQRGEGGRSGRGGGRGGGGQPQQEASYDSQRPGQSGGGGGGGQREGSFDSGGAPDGGQRREGGGGGGGGRGRGRGRGRDPFPRSQEQQSQQQQQQPSPGFQPQSFPALQDLSQVLPTQGAWKKPSPSGEPPQQQGTLPVQVQPAYFPSDSKTAAAGASGDSAKKPKSQPQQQQQQQQQKRSGGRGGGGGGGGDASAGPQQQQQSKPAVSSSARSTSVEDTKIQRINTGDAEIVSKIAKKPGTKGRIIKVESNHLDLNLGRLTECYHYDVQVEPDKPKRFIRRVLEEFRVRNYPQRYPAFDGVKNIYSVHPLTRDIYDVIEGEVRIRDEDGREKAYKVAIKFANKVDLTPMQNFLQNPATPTEAIQVVDIVLRMAAVQNCIPAGRSFFMRPTNGIMELGDGMEMYQGFYQSAIRGWKPLLNIDVSHKAFPKAIPVVDTLCELLSGRDQFRREHLSTVRPADLEKLRKYITTLRVVYEIPGQPGTKKTYRVNGLGPRPADYTFKHNDAPVNTFEYFARFKNYRIQYPDLPTLWVGNAQREDKIYIPLELCRISEGQPIQRKMNELQTSKMIRFSATDTATRKKKINTGIHTANYNANACVKEFGFSVGSEFQKLDARVLQPPELQYASNRGTRVSKGVWRSDHFLNAATVNKWTIANVARFAPRPDDYKRMADMLKRAGHNVGMQFTTPPVEPFRTIGQRQAYGEIEEYFRQKKRENYDVIFVVVPDSGPQYSYVKKAAETVAGCLTQCIKTSTVGRKMNDQTATNILLKLNSKLNGINHTFTNSCKPTILQRRPVMIMGADVTHPGPDSQNVPSVAAVTASHDPQALFKYNICWRLQNPKAEIIEDLEAITIEHLKFFYRMNRHQVKPESIIFFRDGVSEGQFEQVRRDEIRAIKSACKRLQADGYEPSITFVVVQKRHHTRLFPLNPRDSEDRNCNVPAGTCVDNTITHPFLQDFYLVSHASIQGVAKPTKYVTLLDENSMSNDDIEELAFYLCHMFSRCTRSVSYPAPTYYAHLAAARAKVYIENDHLDMRKLAQEARKFETLDVIRKDLPMFFV